VILDAILGHVVDTVVLQAMILSVLIVSRAANLSRSTD
jgi:hypothetical protein